MKIIRLGVTRVASSFVAYHRQQQREATETGDHHEGNEARVWWRAGRRGLIHMGLVLGRTSLGNCVE